MTKFFTFTTPKRVLTVKADNSTDAKIFALACILKREVEKRPRMSGDTFEALQGAIIDELDQQPDCKVYP